MDFYWWHLCRWGRSSEKGIYSLLPSPAEVVTDEVHSLYLSICVDHCWRLWSNAGVFPYAVKEQKSPKMWVIRPRSPGGPGVGLVFWVLVSP